MDDKGFDADALHQKLLIKELSASSPQDQGVVPQVDIAGAFYRQRHKIEKLLSTDQNLQACLH